jgi:putative heme-binding domain-containing protein
LDAIAAGQASPRLLLEKQTRERLTQLKLDGADERIAKLTKGLPPPDQQVQKLIDTRVKNYATAKTSLALGAKIFEKTCMLCHSMEGKGASIGPQLDGVGARGLDRIVEDVLDPSRNVDAAFRLSVVKFTSGQVYSGLKRREEGAQVVFADAKGVETSFAKQDIKEIRETQMSLMPDGLVETMTPEEFNHLLAFLLSKVVKH